MNIVANLAKLAAVAGLSLSMTLSAALPASAAPTSIADSLTHFFSCLGTMFSPEHATECGPGHEFTGQFSQAWGSEPPPPAKPQTCSVPGAFHDPRTADQYLWLASPAPCCPVVSQLEPGADPQVLQVDSCCVSYEPLGGFDPQLLEVGCCIGPCCGISARLEPDPSIIEVSAPATFGAYLWAVC